MSMPAYAIPNDSMDGSSAQEFDREPEFSMGHERSDGSESNQKRKIEAETTTQNKKNRVAQPEIETNRSDESARTDEANDFLDFIHKLRNGETTPTKADNNADEDAPPRVIIATKLDVPEEEAKNEDREQAPPKQGKSKKSSKQSSKQVSKQSSKTSKQTPKQATKEASKHATKQASKQASKKTSKSKQVSKQVSKQSSSQASKPASNKASKQASKQTSKQASKQASKKASKQLSKKEPKQSSPQLTARSEQDRPDRIDQEEAIRMLKSNIAGLASANQDVTSRDLRELQLQHELRQQLLAQPSLQLQGSEANQGSLGIQELAALSQMQNEQTNMSNYLHLLGGEAAAVGNPALGLTPAVDNTMLRALAARNGMSDVELLRSSALNSRMGGSGLEQLRSQLLLSGMGEGLAANDMIANNDPLVSALMQEKLLRMGELGSGAAGASFSSIPPSLRPGDASSLSALSQLSALSGANPSSSVSPELRAAMLQEAGILSQVSLPPGSYGM